MNANAYIVPDTCGNVSVYFHALPFDLDDGAEGDAYFQGDAATDLLTIHNVTNPIAGIVYPVQWHDDLPVTL